MAGIGCCLAQQVGPTCLIGLEGLFGDECWPAGRGELANVADLRQFMARSADKSERYDRLFRDSYFKRPRLRMSRLEPEQAQNEARPA